MGELHKKTVSASVFASYADFCEIFEADMSSLYLLSYLLTADDEQAEACLLAAIEESSSERQVFRGWARPWIRHTIIKAAARLLTAGSLRAGNPHQQHPLAKTPQAAQFIHEIARLPVLDRFSFVLNVLEGYSPRQCAVLMNTSADLVARHRAAAGDQLARTLSALGGIPSGVRPIDAIVDEVIGHGASGSLRQPLQFRSVEFHPILPASQARSPQPRKPDPALRAVAELTGRLAFEPS